MEEVTPAESAPTHDSMGGDSTKSDEILKVVDDQEQPQVFQSPSADDEEDYVADDSSEEEVEEDDEEDSNWKEVIPPPSAPTLAEDVDEKYDDVPSKAPPETPGTVATAGTTLPPGQVASQSQHLSSQEEAEPDFSQCKTNVGRRLWLAQEKAEKAGMKSSPDMVPLTREFQKYRKDMNNLIRYIDEYQEAMRLLKAKRTKLFEHYAAMAKGTPIWDHVGKPLTPEQVAEIQNRGDEVTPESIELQSKSILKVADEIGAGSLVAFQQLAAMQDKLNELDYQTHIIDYVDEWDDVVTTKGDDEAKALLELNKKRDHYVHKVDRLRKRVNKIEHRGFRDAPDRLQQKLDRNEDKLDKADALFEDKANDVSVVLNESVRRGWVDLYPLIKNAIKFEVNRLGRESSTYGRLTGTLSAFKSDYKEAVKGTDDDPNSV